MTAPTPAKPWRKGRLRGLVLPGYEDLDPEGLPWDEAAAKQPLPGIEEVAKRSRSRLVLRIEHAGEVFYVKRAVPRTIPRRLSAWILGPKAFREWRTGRQWLAAGLRVPEPVLVASSGRRLSYLVTRSLPGSWVSLSAWFKEHGLDLDALREAGRLARALHDASAFHADFRTDHIYRTDAPEQAPLLERFALIDLDGATIGRKVPFDQRGQALVQLLVSLHRRDASTSHAAALVAGYEETSSLGLDAEKLLERARGLSG